MKKKYVVLGMSAMAAFLLALRGRRDAKGLEAMEGWLFAHRGYHMEPDAPENSLAAFRRAVENGYGAELDVHLLSDGNLAVLHDSRLYRMTGRNGIVEALTEEELPGILLGRSRQPIPTLAQVLELVDGRVPLIIELKTYRNNYRRLCERVFEELDHYQGPFCVESFHPQVVRWLRKNRPEVIRGQLSMNYLHERNGLSLPAAAAATGLVANFLTRPDFIAYRFCDRRTVSNRLCLSLWKIQGASWTLHDMDELKTARREGLWPIFENFDPATGKRLERAEDT